MDAPTRSERQILRRIQSYLQAARDDAGVVLESLGTVDLSHHATDPNPELNCAVPHKGAAWVRRDDLLAAFARLDALGREPRLVYHEALFPAALQQQLEAMGLVLERTRAVLVYQPVVGPAPPGESLFGRLPDALPQDVTARAVSSADGLSTWLPLFDSAYAQDADALSGAPDVVAELVAMAAAGQRIFVTAWYQDAPLGAACAGVRDTVAELEAVVTAPLWHGMGLEEALIVTATRQAEARGCTAIFTIQAPRDARRMYRRLGFMALTRVLTFGLPGDAETAL